MSEVVKATGNKSSDRLGELDKEIKELSLKIENRKKAVEKGIELDNTVDIINRYVFQGGSHIRRRAGLWQRPTEAIAAR